MADFSHVLKDLAGKIGKALGEDAAKAEHRLMHSTGDNLEASVKAHVEHDAEAAAKLKKAAGGEEHIPTTHGGSEGSRGTKRGADDSGDARPSKSARTSGSGAGKEVADVGRRTAIRNESGLPQNASTAEQRRAYDKQHGTEPPWSKVTEQHHGPRPTDMTRPHGHHIVYKEGAPGPIRDTVAESKQILERNGVDWYTGPHNLTWAPNRGHSLANAQSVLDRLRAADGQGHDAVVAALRGAGRDVFKGRP